MARGRVRGRGLGPGAPAPAADRPNDVTLSSPTIARPHSSLGGPLTRPQMLRRLRTTRHSSGAFVTRFGGSLPGVRHGNRPAAHAALSIVWSGLPADPDTGLTPDSNVWGWERPLIFPRKMTRATCHVCRVIRRPGGRSQPRPSGRSRSLREGWLLHSVLVILRRRKEHCVCTSFSWPPSERDRRLSSPRRRQRFRDDTARLTP